MCLCVCVCVFYHTCNVKPYSCHSYWPPHFSEVSPRTWPHVGVFSYCLPRISHHNICAWLFYFFFKSLFKILSLELSPWLIHVPYRFLFLDYVFIVTSHKLKCTKTQLSSMSCNCPVCILREGEIKVNTKEHLNYFQLKLIDNFIFYSLQVEHSQILEFFLPSLYMLNWF